MSTRRTFLKQSALATAGILIAPSSFSNIVSNKKTEVIIIGAGFAGLAAANRLKQKGVNFTILESQNRIGGRVFSHKMDENLVVELGGEWIGESHTRIQQLCGELKLNLLNNQMDTHLIYKGNYFPKDKWNYSEAWIQKFQDIKENYKNFSPADKVALDRYDWWHYLINNGCDGRDLEIRELLDSTDFGESIRHVSAFSALAEYAESSEKNEMDKKIIGGNGLLADRLAEKIGKENILLNHRVSKIIQINNKVKVLCENGRSLEADKIICTLPGFALNKIDWLPALPAEKIQAINELQYARINKHALLYNERFWKDESFDLITDELPHYLYHATKGQPSAKGILISYSVGDKANVIANQSNLWNASEIQRTLQPHFGEINQLLEKQVNFNWGNNDYSKGAYALYKPGQWFNVMPKLKEEFIHTYFAGEHLAEWQGFMEGAVNTGEEAADKI
ncbi:FAD-dependent oxidoreductase [Pedobacter sp. PAMC26386]|nr:FAD-dependent oxidoreductase [Pedobacter sp. PAMC26386]